VWEQVEFERMCAHNPTLVFLCENVRPKSWQDSKTYFIFPESNMLVASMLLLFAVGAGDCWSLAPISTPIWGTNSKTPSSYRNNFPCSILSFIISGDYLVSPLWKIHFREAYPQTDMSNILPIHWMSLISDPQRVGEPPGSGWYMYFEQICVFFFVCYIHM